MLIACDYRKVYEEGVSSPSIPDAITHYQDQHLTARNLAPLTRLNYASDFKQLRRYLTDELRLVLIDQVRPLHLDGYLVTLDQRGLRGSSRRRTVATIRSLFRFVAVPARWRAGLVTIMRLFKDGPGAIIRA